MSEPPCKGEREKDSPACREHKCFSSLRNVRVDLEAPEMDEDMARLGVDKGHVCYDMGWELARDLSDALPNWMVHVHNLRISGCHGLVLGFRDFVKLNTGRRIAS